MHRSTPTAVATAALLGVAAIPTIAAPSPGEDTLEKRAILPAEATAPAPWNGAANTEPAPAPGSRQPVGGFSALLDAAGRDVFWAMPDNDFGNKANSRSFILRVIGCAPSGRPPAAAPAMWRSSLDRSARSR